MNIEILNATKEYNSNTVLEIEQLKFEEGNVYALMGANGSGKTTLLECASGIDRFTKGEVLYDNGKDIELVRNDIAVMLQKPYLFNCSVIENISMGLKFRRHSQEVIDERISQYLDCFEIKGFLNKNARQLSVGEQAKVALLRTAILEAPVTFLDEPTASMDIENTLKTEQVIKKMTLSNRCVILVTHDILQAKRTADYVIFLDNGRIIEWGKTDEIFKFPKHNLLKEILMRGE